MLLFYLLALLRVSYNLNAGTRPELIYCWGL